MRNKNWQKWHLFITYLQIHFWQLWSLPDYEFVNFYLINKNAFLQIFVSQQFLFLFSKHLDIMSNVTDCGNGQTDICLIGMKSYIFVKLTLFQFHCNRKVGSHDFGYTTIPFPTIIIWFMSQKALFKEIEPMNWYLMSTVWSEGFLHKVAPPELKISPNVYFIMYNSVVISKIMPIIVPFSPYLSMSIIIKIINFIK